MPAGALAEEAAVAEGAANGVDEVLAAAHALHAPGDGARGVDGGADEAAGLARVDLLAASP